MWDFIIHSLMAIGLFYIVNWVGKHSLSFGYMQLSVFSKTDEAPAFNYFFRIVAPLVYILLVSSILYSLGLDPVVQDIYRVVIYYFVFRLFFNLSFDRALLLNWKSELLILLTSTFAAYQLYDKIISTKQRLIPDFNTIANELWVVILIFLYGVLNNVRISSKGTEKRKGNYLKYFYNIFKNKYGGIVESKVKDKTLEALIYAIMIYESFNRPRIVRGIERLLFRFGKSKTLGIMQVTTDRKISDEESVEIGIDKILNDYTASYQEISKKHPDWKISMIQYEALSETVLKYNRSAQYLDEVLTLHEIILDKFYPEVTNAA
jgi:hypothetical protein